jgi:serine phosphatase RsbU (regulator of sigma subunit)
MLKRLSTTLYILALILLAGCGKEEVDITINVKAENMPAHARVFIIGNQQQLGRWTQKHNEMRLEDSLWTVTVSAPRGSEFAFKVTRGRWHFEAVDSNGVEWPNISFIAAQDTSVFVQVNRWRDQVEGPPLISKQRFENKGWSIELSNNWLFHTGDDTTWARVDFDDSEWQPIRTQMPDRTRRTPRDTRDAPPDSIRRLRPRSPEWDGIGWFRLHVVVDSSIVNFPLSLHMRQNGASEIYLNGEKLYSFGKVSSIADLEKIYTERNPKPLIFDRPGEHLFAVRYSFHRSERLFDIPMGRGFDMWLGHLDNAITARTKQIRSSSFNQLVFTAIPLSFAAMHLLLFIFYRRSKNNLYYALSMFFFAVMAYTQFGHTFSTTAGAFLWLLVLEIFSTVFAIAFGMFSVYSTIYKKLPKIAFIPFIFLTLFVFAALLLPQIRSSFQIILYIFLFLCIIELVRLTITSRKSDKEWNWIISAGFTVTLLIFAYQALLVLGVLPPIGKQMLVWMYSIPVLALSLSTYISLNFSRTHIELETQLDRVKQLSEEKIAQERIAKEIEIQRRVLEADNKRKTEELEEARQLQLSMLPKNVPQLPGIDIAVSMKTATEVGGDYYDFHTDGSGLTIAIGDATGHGMRAGTMVTAIKSLFSANNNLAKLPDTLSSWSQIIRQMNFGNLYMAMSLLRVEHDKVIISNAGMPPALLYRAKDKSVEEIILKGMPLGGAAHFDYDQHTIEIEPGDTLLLMSDGFTELFNENNDMYDERAISAFEQSAHLAPRDIIDHLNHECQTWRGQRPQNDDITFVVVKFS